jgi:hypothetical protein
MVTGSGSANMIRKWEKTGSRDKDLISLLIFNSQTAWVRLRMGLAFV